MIYFLICDNLGDNSENKYVISNYTKEQPPHAYFKYFKQTNSLIYQKISFIVQQKIICDSCKSTKITYNNIQQVNFPVSAGNLSSFIQNYFKEKIETCGVWRQ